MPILHSAIKKVRVDRKKRNTNKVTRTKVSKALDKARTEKSLDSLKMAFSVIDRAAKKHVFHTGKADRLKSRLAKLIAPKS